MISMRSIRLVGVIVLAVGLSRIPAAWASAVEDLARRMPDEVLAFVGTSGGDVLKGDFEKTVLGRMWNDPGVQTFCRSIKTELLAKAGQQSGDPNVAQKVEIVLNGVRLALSRPVVLGAAQVPVQQGPPIAGFAILDAGERKAEFAMIVSMLEAMAGQSGIGEKEIGSLKLHTPAEGDAIPLYWGWAGNCFVVAVNDAQGAAVKYLPQPRSTAPAFLSKLPDNGDLLALYYDYQKIVKMIDTVVRQEEGEKAAGMLAAVVKRLGMSDLKSETVRVGFAGTDLVIQAFIQMPAPTSGLFATFKPVDLTWLRAVDVRAVTASAINWDLGGAYDTIMGTVKTAVPEGTYTAIRNAIAGVESEAKVRIREDLLASLAGPMVSYMVPAGVMPEAPMGGLVVVARLADAALFEKAMTALGEFAGEQAGGMLQVGSQTRDDGRVVHLWTIAPLAIAGMMPSWSVANGHVVIGSNAELCDRGVAQLLARDADAKSLLDAEGYKKVASQLPKDLLSFTYTDSQVQFNQTMLQVRQVWPMLTMMAMQAGFKLPMTLPTLTQIAKDMGPSCSYSAVGPDGFYSYNRGPGVDVSLASVAGGALGAGIIMPALARAREQARIAASMAHLKQIGLAMHMYADDHDDRLPSALDQAQKYYGDAKVLESPRKPKGFEGPSYIYIPDQTVKGYPGNIVAYENPEFAKEKILALFLDGHVEVMPPDRFRSELDATYERLDRKMPRGDSQDEDPGEKPATKTRRLGSSDV